MTQLGSTGPVAQDSATPPATSRWPPQQLPTGEPHGQPPRDLEPRPLDLAGLPSGPGGSGDRPAAATPSARAALLQQAEREARRWLEGARDLPTQARTALLQELLAGGVPAPRPPPSAPSAPPPPSHSQCQQHQELVNLAGLEGRLQELQDELRGQLRGHLLADREAVGVSRRTEEEQVLQGRGLLAEERPSAHAAGLLQRLAREIGDPVRVGDDPWVAAAAAGALHGLEGGSAAGLLGAWSPQHPTRDPRFKRPRSADGHHLADDAVGQPRGPAQSPPPPPYGVSSIPLRRPVYRDGVRVKRTRNRTAPTMADCVKRGLVPVGPATLTVGQSRDSHIQVEITAAGEVVHGGVPYPSLSSFALAVLRCRNIHRLACDGWHEVRLGGVKMTEFRQRCVELMVEAGELSKDGSVRRRPGHEGTGAEDAQQQRRDQGAGPAAPLPGQGSG
ncbi:hypothetical protein GPECTOR_26g572 [Gonium pectorale]|uniref:RAMA domain-containing protein n=1 Tax=Gonium pectorale TaxID=33097 RepID=A0A150GFQ5_GONPE|nr:hypothetical protein GPECTOR_26g572 [Gonium pectorale]|eukprot:KXZ48669.1 hypothetical protein GPECTOR_26g572 [Gonium pectorale]